MSERIIHTADRRTGRLVAGYLASGGHTQKALAQAMDMTESSLSERIRGTRRWTLDDLFATAQFLDVPVSWLVDPDGTNTGHMLEVRASRCTALSLVAA